MIKFELPTEPTWEWSLGPGFTIGFQPIGPAPGRFHRWMQRVFLGIHWRPIS